MNGQETVCVLTVRLDIDLLSLSYHCRFGYFRENFILVNSIKRHISDVKISRLMQDLPISINERVISPFREGFIFICEVSQKIKSTRKFPDLQYMSIQVSIKSL